MNVVELGTRSYREIWDHQLALVAQRQTNEVPDTLLLVEHPHVFTLGRSRAAEANVLAPGDVEVVAVERGGDVTYHGPGQIVAYPIVLLGDGERDLHRYLRNLEQAVIETCAAFDIVADREPGKTGVWTTVGEGRGLRGGEGEGVGQAKSGGRDNAIDGQRKKLCSMGIACRKWVCFHGLALNVATDLAYFGRINPCGFESRVMGSLSSVAGRPIAVADVQPVLAREIARALGRS